MAYVIGKALKVFMYKFPHFLHCRVSTLRLNNSNWILLWKENFFICCNRKANVVKQESLLIMTKHVSCQNKILLFFAHETLWLEQNPQCAVTAEYYIEEQWLTEQDVL